MKVLSYAVAAAVAVAVAVKDSSAAREVIAVAAVLFFIAGDDEQRCFGIDFDFDLDESEMCALCSFCERKFALSLTD